MGSYIYRVPSGEFHFATTSSENWAYMQSRTKYLEQNTEFRNIGLEKKSLISIFAWFLIAFAKVEFLEDRLGTRLCLHPKIFLKFWDFSNIS